MALDQQWRKSSYSGAEGQCVEVRRSDLGGVQIRDSKNPDGPVLGFTVQEWAAFQAGIADGEFLI